MIEPAAGTLILIAEDDALTQRVLEAILTPDGYRLRFAADGAEALAAAQEIRPDLLLLDVQMPTMDGYEVCRRVRAEARLAEMPIIMVTALGDRESRLQGLEAGADDFLSKPFDRVELAARVRTIARLNRYRRVQEADRLRDDLRTAAAIQQQLLPRQAPTVPGLDLYGRSRPAAVVGGDCFDFVWRDGRLFLFVADVAGHGVSSALFVSTARSTIRAALPLTPDLVTLAEAVNQRMVEDAGDSGMFLTAVLASYEPASRMLTIVNCGHPEPLVVRRGAAVEPLRTAGPAIGILDRLDVAPETTVLAPGDLVVLHTDAVLEAHAWSGELFGAARLAARLAALRERRLCEIDDALHEAATDFQGSELDDDWTVVLARPR